MAGKSIKLDPVGDEWELRFGDEVEPELPARKADVEPIDESFGPIDNPFLDNTQLLERDPSLRNNYTINSTLVAGENIPGLSRRDIASAFEDLGIAAIPASNATRIARDELRGLIANYPESYFERFTNEMAEEIIVGQSPPMQSPHSPETLLRNDRFNDEYRPIINGELWRANTIIPDNAAILLRDIPPVDSRQLVQMMGQYSNPEKTLLGQFNIAQHVIRGIIQIKQHITAAPSEVNRVVHGLLNASFMSIADTPAGERQLFTAIRQAMPGQSMRHMTAAQIRAIERLYVSFKEIQKRCGGPNVLALREIWLIFTRYDRDLLTGFPMRWNDVVGACVAYEQTLRFSR